jgi:putative transposase
VTLANRRSSALVDHIGALRAAFRVCRRERPFAIDAIVVLPDHLHAILTLPPRDAASRRNDPACRLRSCGLRRVRGRE